MGVIVQKFGGTSLGDLSRIRRVAGIIKKTREFRPNVRTIVTASAMAGETNRLLTLAKSLCSQPQSRELDAMISTGENVSAALLAMALIEIGIPARSLNGDQAGIHTEGSYGEAQIKTIDTSKITRVLDAGLVPVVTGFQGVMDDQNICTLGRGGGDITALALAAAFEADACEIFTDVDGVFSADPKICKNAKILKQVSYEEMLELASAGAKVLHPRSVLYGMRYDVPLLVLSTFSDSPGTWVVKEEELMEKPLVSGISAKTDEALVIVRGLAFEMLPPIFEAFAKQQIYADMLTQNKLASGDCEISFTVADNVSSQAYNIIQESLPNLQAEAASVQRNVAKVSIIGIGLRYNPEVQARVLSALKSSNIEIQGIVSSEVKISLLLARKYSDLAVRVLHKELIE